MLDNVLKVPMLNRPNRSLIKQMLVQQKQVNNLFSEKLSFKKASRHNQVRDNYFKQQANQMSFRNQTIENRRNSEISLVGDLQYNMDQSKFGAQKYSILQDQQISEDPLWNVPNLQRQSIDNQRNSMDCDNDEYLEVSKLSIMPKEMQPKAIYKNPKSMRLTTASNMEVKQGVLSGFNTSYYNTNNDSIKQLKAIEVDQIHNEKSSIQNDNQNSITHEDGKNQHQTILIQESEINQNSQTISNIDHLSHMEIKITKPKTAQIQTRKRREMSESANNYDYLDYIDQTIKSYKNANMGSNSKISVFMHLAQPQQLPLLSTERNRVNHNTSQLDSTSVNNQQQQQQLMLQSEQQVNEERQDNCNGVDSEILKAYQNLKEEQRILLQQETITQSFVNGPLAQLFPQHKQILSRSKMMLIQQMHSQSYNMLQQLQQKQSQQRQSQVSSQRPNSLQHTLDYAAFKSNYLPIITSHKQNKREYSKNFLIWEKGLELINSQQRTRIDRYYKSIKRGGCLC
eukprot:403332597